MRFVSVVLLFLCLQAYAQIRPFQTTRLHSTGGAGVASILVTEAAVLNPASLSFFNETFVSYQNTKTSLHNEADNDRDGDDRPFPGGNRQEGYFLFDNASSLKGGFSYQTQRENGFKRKRGTATMAAPIGENMAYGLLYRYTEDTRPGWYSSSRHKVSHPFAMGFTWVVMNELTLGAVWDDPTRATPGESRAMIGAQYALTGDFLLLVDAGGDPTADFYDKRIWRGAAQYNIFSDFFIRAGKFQDRALNLEGEAWGVSWTGPKLGIDFAMKNSRQIEDDTGYLYENEKLTDVSFTVGIKF